MNVFRLIVGLFLALTSFAEDANYAEIEAKKLKRITVTGDTNQEYQVPGSADIISGKSLEIAKGATDDINRILKQVPGVNVVEEDGFGQRPNIGLRGVSSERSANITLMEDGILVAPAPYSAPSAYFFPSTGRMSGIEVLKGASQIKYGPRTTGGSLNLLSTPIPQDYTFNLDVKGGSFDTFFGHMDLGKSYKYGGWMLETYQGDSKGFKDIDGGGDSGFGVQDYVGKFRINTDANLPNYQELELKVGDYSNNANETYLGLTKDDFKNDPYRRYFASRNDTINVDNNNYSLKHYIDLGNGLDLTTTGYFNETKRNWYKLENVNGNSLSDILDTPNDYQADLALIKGEQNSLADALKVRDAGREFSSRGIQSVFGAEFETGKLNHDLEFGVREHYDYEDRLQKEDGYQILNGDLIKTSTGVAGSQANRKIETEALALHVQDKIEYEKITVTPGLRYEKLNFKYSDFGKKDTDRTGLELKRNYSDLDVIIPGIGTHYRLNDDVGFIAGVHKGFAPPAPSNNDGIKEEESVNYELGTIYDNGIVQGDVTLFYNDYSNLLGADTLSSGGLGTGDLFNAGRAQVQGFESSLKYDLSRPLNVQKFKLPTYINYTYTDAEFEDNFDSSLFGLVQSGDAIPYIAKNQTNLGTGVEVDKLGVYLSMFYLDSMPTIPGEAGVRGGAKTDSHVIFDLNTKYQVRKDTSVFFVIENLFDRDYIAATRPAGARPGRPLTFLTGFRYSF